MTVFPYPELDAEKEAEYELFPINLTRMMLHTKGQTVPYLAPPRVETDMEGRGDDDYTMSVDDFIAETMSLPAGRPDAGEVIVKAARRLREAERHDVYAELFAAVNPNSLAAARKEVL
jgi:short-subunit dehydrogenase involved in D-alanine esterification of teichoic acids